MDDLISRHAVLALPIYNEKNLYGNIIREYVDIEDVKKLPPAEPKRIKARWIAMENKNLFSCSECDAVIYSESEHDRNEFHKFCGRCGADMREVTT